ncbi:NAD(P)H-hydrate dehydratase [Candidatus Micrarchaeota archaeon CG11_big_fil_rev_8_21_14_0_20_47_5]|nr:MAG: NAD(P)H-hydrate dehydratase [Candidatus Micrarchaeota archaeon CG11_big_fil_rev_8_21_14_0_20_47_5]
MLNLAQPKPSSHKGENGKLLIFGGGKTYHGAPLLAAIAASQFVDLVYFSSIKENMRIARKMKEGMLEVIVIERKEAERKLKEFDCILFGCGIDESKENGELLRVILKTKARCVLDATAFSLLSNPLLLHENVILTPHEREFERLFGMKASRENAERMARKYGCTILLKGKIDVIAGGKGKIKLNRTGNAGMTKGGTGDVLAGVCASFFCKNSAFTSACAAAFLNGKAGNLLYKKKGNTYTAGELARRLGEVYFDLIS